MAIDLRADMLVKAVSEYWKSTQIDIKKDSELALLSSSLKEIEQHSTTPTLFRKKLSISSTTAKDWLHRLGYHWGEVKKGVYKDGHERPDVVNYRQEVFLKTYEELASVMPYPVRHENGDVEVHIPIVPEGQTLIIPVTHDECTCNANDGPHYQWVRGDHIPLRSKSRGQGIHISEFVTPWGRLRVDEKNMSDEDLIKYGLHKREATEIIQCGGDIWWDQEKIVQQTLTAITIFEAAHPGCCALFLFDNATSHSAFASNALRGTKMNKGPGGAQPHMRDGWYIDKNGVRMVQKMCYGQRERKIPKSLWGEPKGLEVILKERGLWPKEGLYLDCTQRNNVPKNQRKHSEAVANCCARKLISQQPDFLSQKGRVQEVVEGRGHRVLFYPRFHCELNWIEYFWARVKLYTRKNCGYDIKSLRENVPLALTWASDLIPKWWSKSLRIMDTYRAGAIYGTEEFRVKAYKSHRRVSSKV